MNLVLTFLVGGALCAAAQILIDKTRLSPARILVGYVVLGVVLFALGIYTPLFEAVGCGISIPLVGFGANIAKGVKNAVDTTGAIGILTGGLTSSAAGITAALLFGFLASVLSKSKSKRM